MAAEQDREAQRAATADQREADNRRKQADEAEQLRRQQSGEPPETPAQKKERESK